MHWEFFAAAGVWQIYSTKTKYINIALYTATSKKKMNIMKKVNIFCHSFQKVKPIYYIDSLNIEWNISSLYFLKFWWLWLTDNENSKFSVSENLHNTEYYIRSIKMGYFKQKCQASEKYVHFYAWISQYLVVPPFAWITASMQRGNQPVALLRCNRSTGCFDSSLQVICIVGSGFSHLPLDNTP